jgi:Parkin co-regulated protein
MPSCVSASYLSAFECCHVTALTQAVRYYLLLLLQVEDPFRFLAIQGTLDMIVAAPEKVLPVIPQLILPMKTALNTRTPDIICPVLKILQQMMLLNPTIGQALVPYYRCVFVLVNQSAKLAYICAIVVVCAPRASGCMFMYSVCSKTV